jgi:broad specificity phosphatase PhoE
MPKKMLFERRAARLARAKQANPSGGNLPGTGDAGAIPSTQIPHEAITDSPSPSLTSSMAAGGEPIVRGNSNLQPMTSEGHTTVKKVGQQLAALGGPDEIDPAASFRAMQTAADVGDQTGAPVGNPNPDLDSHAMGNLEGEQKTPEIKKFIRDSIRKNPNLKIPGQGAMSSNPGESFNEFRVRGITGLIGLAQKLAANPTGRYLAPTSSQLIKLAKAWIAAGAPDSMAIDHREMMKDDAGKPGEIERMFPTADGKWELNPFNPKTAPNFPPGIYLMRHGETSSVQAHTASEGQKARANLIGHIRSGNYQGAKEVAKSAHAAGHLNDDEISSAIDESLPSADEAQRLPNDQLLAAASAAGASKRAELLPTLQQRFSDLSSVSPEGKHALASHLGRLGVRSKL